MPFYIRELIVELLGIVFVVSTFAGVVHIAQIFYLERKTYIAVWIISFLSFALAVYLTWIIK